MKTRLAWRALTALPRAVQTTTSVLEAAATAVGALVVVTSFVPVFAVCLAVLRARGAGSRPAQSGSRIRSRIRLIPARGIAAQSGRLSSS